MDTETPQSRNRAGHEERDANVRALAYFGLVLFGVIALTLIGMRTTFFHFAKSQQLGPPPTPFENARTLPPMPRLQVDPRMDLKNYREQEEDILKNYGWVDKQNGVVRIPIDRAMSLLLERGLPARQTKPPADTAALAAVGPPAAAQPAANAPGPGANK
jgi:hypothetical protein